MRGRWWAFLLLLKDSLIFWRILSERRGGGMLEIINNLVSTLGYSSIWVVAIITLFKFVIKPAYDSFLKNRLDVASIKEQSKYKIEEMHEQSKLENENKLYSSKLELETIKMNNVLPVLEEINSLIMEHRLLYNSYTHSIVNKGGFPKDREQRRLEIDGKMIELKDKISIYLPVELRTLLNRCRVIMSVSWKEPIVLNRTLHSLDIKPIFVLEKVNEIYSDYNECFYEMVSEYITVGSRNTDYSIILAKFNLQPNGEHCKNEPLYRVAKAYILYHEYTDSNEVFEVNQLFESN
jgi:hypothetical protein